MCHCTNFLNEPHNRGFVLVHIFAMNINVVSAGVYGLNYERVPELDVRRGQQLCHLELLCHKKKSCPV